MILVPLYNGDVYLIISHNAFKIPLQNVIQTEWWLDHIILLTRDGHMYFSPLSKLFSRVCSTKLTVPILLSHLDDIKQIIQGYNNLLILKNDGKIFMCDSSILTPTNRLEEVNALYGSYIMPKIDLISDLNIMVQLAASSDHILALDCHGFVHAKGMNNKGQLGLNKPGGVHNFIIIPDLHDIVEIAAGSNYSLALTSCGHVYIFGMSCYIPRLIEGLEEIIQISIVSVNRPAAWKQNYALGLDFGIGLGLTYDGQVVKFTLDGVTEFLEKDVCEIFYTNNIIVQRHSDNAIHITKDDESFCITLS